MAMSGASSGASSSAATSASNEDPAIAVSERMARYEKSLDLTMYIQQIEDLIAQPIKIPSNHMNGTVPLKPAAQNFFSTKGIWPSKEAKHADIATLYNQTTDPERRILLDILMNDSDDDSGDELKPMTVGNIRDMLKVHKMREKYQARYHNDPLNSQYKYYGSGLMSAYDRFPQYQREVRNAFGYEFPEDFVTSSNVPQPETMQDASQSDATTPTGEN